MPDSSQGEQAVAGSGEQERSLADTTNGGRPRPLLRSLEYPCTARLRLRRLLAYQRRYSHWEIYDAARDKMVVFFDVRYLVDRVMFGMWRTACKAATISSSFTRPQRRATKLAPPGVPPGTQGPQRLRRRPMEDTILDLPPVRTHLQGQETYARCVPLLHHPC